MPIQEDGFTKDPAGDGGGGSAPSGTGFVKVTDGAYDTPGPLSADDIPTGVDAAKIADGSVSNAEFQRLNGVTSDIQTQLNGKQAAFTGTPDGTKFAADDGTFKAVSATEKAAQLVQTSLTTDQSLTAFGANALAMDRNDTITDAGMHSTSSNKSRFIAVETGKHRIDATLTLQNAGSAGDWTLRVALNGTILRLWRGAAAAGYIHVHFSWALNLSAGDYLEVIILPTVGLAARGGSSTTDEMCSVSLQRLAA